MSKKRSHNATGRRKRDVHSHSTIEPLTKAAQDIASSMKRSEEESRRTRKLTIVNLVLGGVTVPALLFFLGLLYRPVMSPARITLQESKSARKNTQEGNEQAGVTPRLPGVSETDSSPSLEGDNESALRTSSRTSEDRRILLSIGDSGRVGLRSDLRGTTPYITRKHYAVVTPPNGSDWVTPMSVGVDGKLRGDPQFGEGTIGIGDSYVVRVLVTDCSLLPGQLSVFPGDAILSDPILVTRL
jgi:hypothetical protein